MTSRAEQRDATRTALIEAARQRFATAGYAEVMLADVVADVGVTKGALYHQFASKLELFRSVVDSVQHDIGQQVDAAAGRESEPWQQLLTGCRTFLQASTAEGARRIVLIDAPALLGWDAWRAIDEANSARHLTEALDELIVAKMIMDQPVEPLAHLISGALNEAALWLLGSPRPDRDLDATMSALTRLLQGLRLDPSK